MKNREKILIIHGPNLALLGCREVLVYGSQTLDDLNKTLSSIAQKMKIILEIIQSDIEGEIVSIIGKSDAEAIIINAGAYTHTSIAIADALRSFKKMAIEVHLSNIYQRESYRHHSYLAPVCHGQISGFGFHSYILALQYMIDYWDKEGMNNCGS